MRKYFFLLFIITIIITFSCRTDGSEILEEVSTYKNINGHGIGKFSVRNSSNDAFGLPLVGISRLDQTEFSLGNGFFDRQFSESSGLGPLFNAKSCASCHFKDGRGRGLRKSTTKEGESSRGFLMRISNGNNPHSGPIVGDVYGEQIQDRGIRQSLVVKPEALISVEYEFIKGSYPDGVIYDLRNPIYKIYGEKVSEIQGVLTSPRVGTQTIGFGFVDALTESELLKNADENDADGDGISGRANYVWNVRANKNTIGKFGWKSNAPTLEQQVAAAFNGDMGMTTSLFPDQNYPTAQQDVVDYFSNIGTKGKGIGEIEISDDRLRKVTFYQAALAVPKRRNFKDKNVNEGEVLFHDLACIKCHVTGLRVGESEMLPMINGTLINPYSDFLLHDMGPELADNRGDFLATGKEWRTMPLWGIGLIKTVNRHTELLHDGRARSVEEAILWHGGEAEQAKISFKNLDKKERQKVLDFINSL